MDATVRKSGAELLVFLGQILFTLGQRRLGLAVRAGTVGAGRDTVADDVTKAHVVAANRHHNRIDFESLSVQKFDGFGQLGTN